MPIPFVNILLGKTSGEGKRRLMTKDAPRSPMDVNFLRRAREALTANYEKAERAARSLLEGWGMEKSGRERPLSDWELGRGNRVNGVVGVSGA